MTGISAPYEAPINPNLEIITDDQTIEASVEIIINFINKKLKKNMRYVINHLRELESGNLCIREIAAQFENPALLFSGGKDSILLTHLAKKPFILQKYHFL